MMHIHNPFSNINAGLKGKVAIKPLEVAMMAYDWMQHQIEFEKSRSNMNDTKPMVPIIHLKTEVTISPTFVVVTIVENFC
jgi:hypothetical protein